MWQGVRWEPGKFDDGDCRTKEPTYKHCGNNKRKTTLQVLSSFWSSSLAEDKKNRCKSKKYCAVYKCDSTYGIGNVKRLVWNYSRRDIRDLGSFFWQNLEDLSLHNPPKSIIAWIISSCHFRTWLSFPVCGKVSHVWYCLFICVMVLN